MYSFQPHCDHRDLHSFPTRRSSDLGTPIAGARVVAVNPLTSTQREVATQNNGFYVATSRCVEDRKSTRLNSSHEWISYAVFCLKKKKTTSAMKSRLVWTWCSIQPMY